MIYAPNLLPRYAHHIWYHATMSDNTPITMTGIQELFDKLKITLTTKIDPKSTI